MSAGRFYPEWVGYPKGAWVVRDSLTGRAYRKPRKRHFWHGGFIQAVHLADALNCR